MTKFVVGVKSGRVELDRLYRNTTQKATLINYNDVSLDMQTFLYDMKETSRIIIREYSCYRILDQIGHELYISSVLARMPEIGAELPLSLNAKRWRR